MKTSNRVIEVISRDSAKSVGAQTYFTGVQCRRGHLSERFVSNGRCKACQVEDNTKNYQANSEVLKAAAKSYREANPDKVRLAKKKWEEKNREVLRHKKRAYNRENRERLNEQKLAWARSNPEKVKKARLAYSEKNPGADVLRIKRWNEENPEKSRASKRAYKKNNPDKNCASVAARRASKKLATPKWLTGEQKAQISAIYREARDITNTTGVKHHVDHIVPLQHPLVCGLHVPWNLEPLPANDNLKKSNKLTA